MQHLILISSLPFLFGPIAFELFRQNKNLLHIIKGVVFSLVIGFSASALLHLSEGANFPLIIFLALAGLFLPAILEKTFKSYHKEIRKLAIIFSLLGVLVHIFVESLILPVSSLTHNDALFSGVLSHRLLVGLIIWSILKPAFGLGRSAVIFLFFPLTAILGSTLGFSLTGSLNTLNLLQALLLGSILHVVFFSHDHHLEDEAIACSHNNHHHNHGNKKNNSYEGFGNLLGGALFLLFFANAGEDGAEYIEKFYALFLLSAPAILLAFIISGLIKAFFPQSSINWINRGKALSQSFKGMAFGLPMPICSCGVLPLYKSLTDKGLAPAAGIALLIATPEIGLDAILISIPLLGFKLTMIRIAAAAFLAICISLILYRYANVKPVVENVSKAKVGNKLHRLNKGMRYAFKNLAGDIAPWLLIGIFIAAIIETGSEHSSLFVESRFDVLFASLIGVVVYVCASGATPLVAALISIGFSPGAAITFLLAGPATNISTYGVLSALHSKKFAFLFMGLISLITILIGFVVNFLFADVYFNVASASALHEEHYGIITKVSALVVAIHFAYLIWQKGARKFFELS